MHNQSIHKQSPGLILLRQLRDEAHRFAIEFQRQKRNKTISDSVFLSIKGMGKKKVQRLLSQYSDLNVIANLETNELAKELSISNLIASKIIDKAKKTIS